MVHYKRANKHWSFVLTDLALEESLQTIHSTDKEPKIPKVAQWPQDPRGNQGLTVDTSSDQDLTAGFKFMK